MCNTGRTVDDTALSCTDVIASTGSTVGFGNWIRAVALSVLEAVPTGSVACTPRRPSRPTSV